MEFLYHNHSATNLLNIIRNEADPRTRKMFLVNDTPIYVWMCSAVYLLFVFFGPKFMQHRKPFDLRGFMLLYNAFLVGLSVYMVYEIWSSAYSLGYNPFCQPFDAKEAYKIPGEDRMANALWWFFFSKVLELMDTILMILRKKNDQVTFLHVFHHVSMVNIWWLCIMLVPGGQSWFSTSLNSLVHTVMYSYYLLNLFPSIRHYLWWKRYITQLQLAQFVLNLISTLYVYFSGCEFPRWSSIMLISYMVIMLILFGNFYVQAYINGKRLTPRHSHQQSEQSNSLRKVQ